MISEIVWSQFHFLRPAWLWLLLPGALVLYFWLNNSSRQDGWQQSCDPELLQAMQLQSAANASRWLWLYWPIMVLTVLALAGPAVRQMPVPMVKNQSALIVALDVSKSMLADDLKPSRLQRAKFTIQDLLVNRQDGQTALVVYSGDAFVVTPLTDDTETIVALLDVLNPSIMPVSGTNTVAALDKATDLLTQAGVTQGQILLVTDRIDLYKTKDRLREVSDRGTTVHVLAVGTAEGAPIPTNQGFLKDLRGQIVIPQVDYPALQEAAKIGQGRFNVLSNSVPENLFYEVNGEADGAAAEDDELGGENFIDEGPLLALLVVPMLALLYRRGILMVWCVGLLLHTESTLAWTWDDLWLNQDQQAHRKLDSAPKEAFEQAKNPDIKAAAAYKNQDYQRASQLYGDGADNLANHYNHGNALARSGDLAGALASYEQALGHDPNDEDTLYNKRLVEKALQQQQEQEQQNQQNSNQQNAEQQEQQDQQDQQNQQNQENQSSSEQEQQEQQQQAQQDQQNEAEQQAQEKQDAAAAQEAAEQDQEEPQEIELTPEEKALDAEEKQAMEQWLRRIKDDPGGLMRRKFLYQYHKRNQDGESYDQQTTEDW
ncbi:vWA domain-containing protein [Marinicella meishanensis]|uniref:vWA domain-containing protein n=1 Tax=Marinicella meishanensis TaxID=2873263 RepID=UPI001CBAE9DF|nr:VWA domain-containing protein [Marinicella sp. NBU2979]